jgi:hypothetical protein
MRWLRLGASFWRIGTNKPERVEILPRWGQEACAPTWDEVTTLLV